MSNFKIIGTPNPEIGKEVIYKIGTSNLPVGILPGQTNPFGSNPFTEEVKWSIYILESGKWILKEKNNKTGPTANYTFTEISLKRRGIRMVARLGEEKATLDIKPHDTIERKIVKVELCDALGNLQTKPFGYNQTVLAKVHCLNLDNCTVHVTLWEDDAPGKGHNEINKNNKAITKTERVSNGIAEVKFRLAPDFAKIADAKLAAGDKSEGKMHEYYVTAEVFRQETKSSNNINVVNPNDNKTADTKAVPAPVSKKPVSQQKPVPKSTAPAAKKGPSKKEEKKVKETSGGSLFDWGESLLKAVPDILPSPSEIANSVAKLFMPDEKEEKNGKKGVCDECTKAITAKQLSDIFPKADSSKLEKVAATYTKYMKDLGMDTCWNKAHLFAQARVESGLSLELKEGEGFNFYYESLSIFRAFQTKEGKEKAKLWGRPTITPKKPGVSLENQKKIANWAYSPPAKKATEIGNTEANDGWNYRGRGLIQVTGKGFYEYCNSYTKKNNLDVVKKPDLIAESIELSILSSMIFFKWKNLNTIANKTHDVINKICPKVGNDVKIKDEKGKSSSNYIEKQKAFNEVTSKAFKIDNCKWGEKVEIPKTKGKFSTYDNEYSAESKTAYINVIVPKDRRTEGMFVFFDDTEIVQKGYALAMGTVNNNFFERNGKGSTPTGLWSSSYSKVHIGEASYGNHGLIHINGMTGDAKKATAPGKRDGIAIHSGHTTKDGINDNGPLMVTYGCVRVYNADMKKLVENYNKIKGKGKTIYVYVEEVDSMDDVYKDYDMVADPKDKRRNYSKNAKQ